LDSPARVTWVSSGHGGEPGASKSGRILLGTPQGSQGETPAIRNATQHAAGRGQRAAGGAGYLMSSCECRISELNNSRTLQTQRTAEGGSWREARPRGQRSILRSMTWCRTPVEDPGRRAGPKVSDEERKPSYRGCLGLGGRSSLSPEIVKLF